MDPVGELSLAARQLVTHGKHIAGLVAAPAHAALGALSWSVHTITRPAGTRGVILEAGALAMHLAMYPWGALAEQPPPGGPYSYYRSDTPGLSIRIFS